MSFGSTTSSFTRALLLGVLAASAWGGPAGPPPPPPGDAAAAPAGLPIHALAYAPGPLDNPLKGLVPFIPENGDDHRVYPSSMAFRYFALNTLMTGPASFDWSSFDAFLDRCAGEGRQAVARVYIEYPDQPSGIPDFLRRQGIAVRMVKQWNSPSPDYDDPRTLKVLTDFLAAWGRRYDGDPRLGFITLGLVGLWGEWHLWPSQELFPKDPAVKAILDAAVKAFTRTRVLVRFPQLAGGYPVGLNLGFHDDSFAYRDDDKAGPRSQTLPESEGGWDWSFLQHMLDEGAENRWTRVPLGGEVRPDIQVNLHTDHRHCDPWKDDVELGHFSWLLDHHAVTDFRPGDKDVDAFARRLGYDFWVRGAAFRERQAAGGSLALAVQWSNEGVAPFYYPWPVTAALLDGERVCRQWPLDWDLRRLQPVKVRAFKDWKLADGAREIAFGAPRWESASLDTAGLAPGRYTLALRVPNPLEARGFAKARPLRFSNAAQRGDGWLDLGAVELTGKAP